jgi:hypothetical protein
MNKTSSNVLTQVKEPPKGTSGPPADSPAATRKKKRREAERLKKDRYKDQTESREKKPV